jgi:hypothetical protein
METYNGPIKVKDLQDYLCGLLQIMLVKVGDRVDDITANNIVVLLTNIFKKQNRVLESGLIAYSGLCNGVKKRINVKDFGQYIVYCLRGDEDECTKLACGLVSDLSSALQQDIQAYLFDFVTPLFEILRHPNKDRAIKLAAIIAIGDLAMNCPLPFASNYISEALVILDSASKQSLRMEGIEDEDTL